MNENKIVFIICVNNEMYYEECCWYLNQLIVPDGFETEIITIREATSIAEAYNAAMESSDAKYKIYMHQDVFICNQYFISDIVEVFQSDQEIGMMGLVGGIKLPDDGIIYKAWNCGRAITCDWSLTVDTCFYQKKPYILVDALDGMLLATQYDVRWREDILKQWDFYDISQSLEFLKAGYKIGIPFQDTAWAVHDCGYSNLIHYDENRKIMFKVYPEFFSGTWEEHPFDFNYELYSLTKQIYKEIENLVNQGRKQEAELILNSFEENGMDKNILLLRHIFTISKMENDNTDVFRLLDKNLSISELLTRYTEIKFFLRRLEIDRAVGVEEIINWIHINAISPMEIGVTVISNLLHRKHVFEVIGKAYRLGNEISNAQIIETMQKKIIEGKLSISPASKDYIKRQRTEAEYWVNHKKNAIL
jgi:hypothetical protein